MIWYQALFLFKGRLNRKGFWCGIGICFIFGLFIANLMPYKMWFVNSMTAIYPLFFLLMILWSMLALAVKRLHDRGRSGVGAILLFLPSLCIIVAPEAESWLAFALHYFMPLFITLLMILDWGVFQGQSSPNQYGEKGLSIRFK